MAKISSFDLMATDLPFKNPFKHAAAERASSNSIFLKCTLDDGTSGFGETLPREYVTGESRDSAFAMLQDRILPHLIGKEFSSMGDCVETMQLHNGKASPEWVDPKEPQTAAWCAVEIALLDAYGHQFKCSIFDGLKSIRSDLRYSAVISADNSLKILNTALKIKLYGIKHLKLKVDKQVNLRALQILRWVLGCSMDIRVDTNMEWTEEEALEAIQEMSHYGVTSFEQPIPADDLDGLARLVAATDRDIMADESLNDETSIQALIYTRACTAVNVRIAKCGGLLAARRRCQSAIEAGLKIQIGCQVGESSLLSAAQLALIAQVPEVRYLEGCFGLHLLSDDPVTPLLQFSHGGKIPPFPMGNGLGITINEERLRRHASKTAVIE